MVLPMVPHFHTEWVDRTIEETRVKFPHVVLLYDLVKVIPMTTVIDGSTPSRVWLEDRGAAMNVDWVQADLGIFDDGPYMVAFTDPDLAFEFRMRWA